MSELVHAGAGLRLAFQVAEAEEAEVGERGTSQILSQATALYAEPRSKVASAAGTKAASWVCDFSSANLPMIRERKAINLKLKPRKQTSRPSKMSQLQRAWCNLWTSWSSQTKKRATLAFLLCRMDTSGVAHRLRLLKVQQASNRDRHLEKPKQC